MRKYRLFVIKVARRQGRAMASGGLGIRRFEVGFPVSELSSRIFAKTCGADFAAVARENIAVLL